MEQFIESIDPGYVIVAGLFTLAGYFVQRWVPSRTRNTTHSDSTSQSVTVDSSMVSQFINLTSRITKLELDHAETIQELAATKKELAETRLQLQETLDEVRSLRKDEAYLQATLHERAKDLSERDVEIQRLARRLETYRRRLKAVEDLVKERLGDDVLEGLPELDDEGG